MNEKITVPVKIIPVFRKGRVIQYDINYADSSWSNQERMEASSMFASCIIRNIEREKAYSIAFIYVMTKKYPDMCFEKTYMDIISTIIC